MTKPLLRWAGSKRRLLPELEQFWPHDALRYVEPFAGSACLFFALQPQTALLSDTNSHLVRTYRTLSNDAAAVYARYLSLPSTKEYYYSIRRNAFTTSDDVDASAHFLYLNRNCFNGLYRTNLRGEFNVPFSDNRNGRILPKDEFLLSAKTLSRAQIECVDFEDILLNHVRYGDFVYLDPPYAIRNSRAFTQYGPDTFGLDDLQRLKIALGRLDEIGVPFVLSYADCLEARECFSAWRHFATTVQRNIAGFAAHRRKSGEILFFGRNTVAASVRGWPEA